MKKCISKKVKSMLDKAENAGRFPDCSGHFDDCPKTEIDAHNPPARCIKCPVYTESRYYRPARQVVADDFMRSVFSKD